MDWFITQSSSNCSYHEDKGKEYCDLLSGGKCEKESCPMIDRFLKRYLLSHESDIATKFEDYGELEGTFESVIGREAKDDAEKLKEELND